MRWRTSREAAEKNIIPGSALSISLAKKRRPFSNNKCRLPK
jgi:hypothetical protein